MSCSFAAETNGGAPPPLRSTKGISASMFVRLVSDLPYGWWARGELDRLGCHQISERDLLWADLVLVMERKYTGHILGVFRDVDPFPLIDSLDIPDEYGYMDEELIDRIVVGTELHLNHRFGVERRA